MNITRLLSVALNTSVVLCGQKKIQMETIPTQEKESLFAIFMV
jgi:hypothetical protein